MCRMSGPQALFDIGQYDTRMLDNLACMRQALLHRRRAVHLERVARTDQPPHPVKAKTLQRLSRDVRMPGVRGVKRPPEQANDLSCRGIWKMIAQIERPPKYIRGRKEGSTAPLSIALYAA